MTRVRIYTRPNDRESEKALLFLDEKGIPFEEIDIATDPARWAELIEATGGADTPQIFLDGERIGGLDDLLEEDRQGRLAATMASGVDQPAR
jgi:glutaredoxin 3